MLRLHGMIDRPAPWDLPRLDAYLEAVVTRMGANRDVMTDASGEPYYVVLAAGRLQDGTLRIDFEADCSGIGMPTNVPFTVTVPPNARRLAWYLGDQLIATTPLQQAPEQAADEALNMDTLLEAHRKWVLRGPREGRGR